MRGDDASPRSFQQTLPSHLPVARWLSAAAPSSAAPAQWEGGSVSPRSPLLPPQSARPAAETLPRQMALLWDETRCLRQQLEALLRQPAMAHSNSGEDEGLSLRNELTQRCNAVVELLDVERAERLQGLAAAEQLRRAADEELTWKFRSGFEYLEGLLQLRTEAHNDMQCMVNITGTRLHRLENGDASSRGNEVVPEGDAADASSLPESTARSWSPRFQGDACEATLECTQRSFVSQSSATSKVLLQRQLSAEKWGSMSSLNALQKFLDDRDNGLRCEIARLSDESQVGSPRLQASLPTNSVADVWQLDGEHKAAMKELFVDQRLDLDKSIALEKVADENKQGFVERFEALASSCWREAERSSYFAQTLDERFQDKFASVQASLEAQLRQSLQRLAEQQDRRCSELSQEIWKLQRRQEDAVTQEQLDGLRSSFSLDELSQEVWKLQQRQEDAVTQEQLKGLRSSLSLESQKQVQECCDEIQRSLEAKDRSEDVPGLLAKLATAVDAKIQREVSSLDVKMEGSLLQALEQQSARCDALMEECKHQFQDRLTKNDTLIEECKHQFQDRLTKNDTLIEECMHQFQDRLTKHDHQVQRDIQLACAAVNGALQDVQRAAMERLEALEPWRSSMDGAVTGLTSTVNSMSASLSGSQMALNKLFEGQKANLQMMIDGLRELVMSERSDRRYQDSSLAERVATLEQSLREGMLERTERVTMLAELLVQRPDVLREPAPSAPVFATATSSPAPVSVVTASPLASAPLPVASGVVAAAAGWLPTMERGADRVAAWSPRSQSPLSPTRLPTAELGADRVADWTSRSQSPRRADQSPRGRVGTAGSEVAPWMTMCAAPPRAAASSTEIPAGEGSPRHGEY